MRIERLDTDFSHTHGADAGIDRPRPPAAAAARGIEAALADSLPFGDAAYIRHRIRLHYQRRLEMLSEPVPAAATLLAALRDAQPARCLCVIGDPVVRGAIDAAVSHYVLAGSAYPRADLDQVLGAATEALHAGQPPTSLSPLAAAAPLAATPRGAHTLPWVWTAQRASEDPLGAIFQRHIERYHAGLKLATPEPHALSMLERGMALLDQLLPRLARSVFAHVQLVAVVDVPGAAVTSLTNPHIPSTFFLSPATLQTPWQAAEYLLHEGLHVKFVDLEHTHSLLPANFHAAPSPMVVPVWNRAYPGNPNEWPINRALTVMHVYTALALFFAEVGRESARLADRFGPLGSLVPARQERRALDRARYLGEHLELHQAHLGTGGRRFTAWLMGMLDTLDPCPAAPGTSEHLVRDLLEREAEEQANKERETLAPAAQA